MNERCSCFIAVRPNCPSKDEQRLQKHGTPVRRLALQDHVQVCSRACNAHLAGHIEVNVEEGSRKKAAGGAVEHVYRRASQIIER